MALTCLVSVLLLSLLVVGTVQQDQGKEEFCDLFGSNFKGKLHRETPPIPQALFSDQRPERNNISDQLFSCRGILALY